LSPENSPYPSPYMYLFGSTTEFKIRRTGDSTNVWGTRYPVSV
jgi:hypothetical protein